MVLLNTESVWTWSHFLFGLTYAIIASLIFLFVVLIFFRPYIKISKHIASHRDEGGKPCFRFKFYNCSIFSGHDVLIDLRELEEIPANPKGKDILVRNIELTTSKFPYIPRFLPRFLVNNYAYHCVQVKTYEDICKILTERRKSLQIRIILKHGLTGLSKNYIRNFHTEKCLIDGEFEFGNSLEVK